ncbi:hypothetical protein AVEN_183449-1 [Araneus ventricosus]|uniref:Uncharacterized protein n=1 Tax=Araneus ventricosus TaxID=182803 RepID=A0A4Y2P243_ARAVE|nr:hypothetical protein AVEN_183449-1 [Araneus ventricosus]
MFNLRSWQYTGDRETSASSVLDEDCLQLNLQHLEKVEKIKVTKREMLSIAQKIFDPLRNCLPCLISFKVASSENVENRDLWDDEVDEGTKREFSEWYNDLHLLKNIKIPRWFRMSSEEKQDISVHTFGKCKSKCMCCSSIYKSRN